MPTSASLRVLERVPPTPGKNLYLSIDARMQNAAPKMRSRDAPGAAVAIDPRNGRSAGDGQRAELRSEPVRQRHRQSGLFHVVDMHRTSRCSTARIAGGYHARLDDEAVSRAWRPGTGPAPARGHGAFRRRILHPRAIARLSRRQARRPRHASIWSQAIAQSVNTYFYSLALDMGIDRFSGWMGNFGFGKPTGIDLLGESAGVLPSREWKRGRLQSGRVPRRNGDCRHRPGLLGDHANPARAGRLDTRRARRASSRRTCYARSRTASTPSRSRCSCASLDRALSTMPQTGIRCNRAWSLWSIGGGTAHGLGDRLSVRHRRQDRHSRALFAHGRNLDRTS